MTLITRLVSVWRTARTSAYPIDILVTFWWIFREIYTCNKQSPVHQLAQTTLIKNLLTRVNFFCVESPLINSFYTIITQTKINQRAFDNAINKTKFHNGDVAVNDNKTEFKQSTAVPTFWVDLHSAFRCWHSKSGVLKLIVAVYIYNAYPPNLYAKQNPND